MTDRDIYRAIWKARKEKFKQAEFAKICGLSRQEIGRIERGDNSVSLSKLIQIADKLDLVIKIEKK